MKKLTKKELQQNADRLMKAHKTDRVFATQDGNYFFKQNDAVFHNNELKKADKEWDGEIISFEAVKKEEAPAPPKESEEVKAAKQEVSDAEAALKSATTAYNKADKAAGKKPDDEQLKSVQEDARKAMEEAQLNLDNAKTKLAALQPQE
ncbi:MAG: hypothetical protein ACT4OJ_01245 [Bacteroidota bacterium]